MLDVLQELWIRRTRLQHEIGWFMDSLPGDVSDAKFEEEELELTFVAPQGSLYKDMQFRLRFRFPPEYPFMPPKLHFLTPIFHPNIDDRVCLDILETQSKGGKVYWKPSYTVESVLTCLQLLFLEPNLDDPLVPEAAYLWKNDLHEFQRRILSKK